MDPLITELLPTVLSRRGASPTPCGVFSAQLSSHGSRMTWQSCISNSAQQIAWKFKFQYGIKYATLRLRVTSNLTGSDVVTTEYHDELTLDKSESSSAYKFPFFRTGPASAKLLSYEFECLGWKRTDDQESPSPDVDTGHAWMPDGPGKSVVGATWHDHTPLPLPGHDPNTAPVASAVLRLEQNTFPHDFILTPPLALPASAHKRTDSNVTTLTTNPIHHGIGHIWIDTECTLGTDGVVRGKSKINNQQNVEHWSRGVRIEILDLWDNKLSIVGQPSRTHWAKAWIVERLSTREESWHTPAFDGMERAGTIRIVHVNND